MKPDQNRMTCCLPCRCPRGEPPARLRGGYIVERIVASQNQRLCFDGLLTICGLPACLCPPLTLCDLDIVCIEPCVQCPDACCPPCGTVMLRFTLECHVTDCCGHRGQGQACIELPAQQCRGAWRGATIRRGAQLQVARACFCTPGSFQVCLYIDLQTVISQCEMVGEMPCSASACPTLPIYPAPAPLPCGPECEHFRVFAGKNPRNA